MVGPRAGDEKRVVGESGYEPLDSPVFTSEDKAQLVIAFILHLKRNVKSSVSTNG